MIVGLKYNKHIKNITLHTFFSSSVIMQVPTQDSSKDLGNDNSEDPNDYVTVNIHENKTFEGRDPGMSDCEIQPYAALVAEPSQSDVNHDYCNIPSRDCRLVQFTMLLSLPRVVNRPRTRNHLEDYICACALSNHVSMRIEPVTLHLWLLYKIA